MERLGYFTLLALLFCHFSRIVEPYWWLHIPRWLLLVTFGIALLQGRFLTGFYHRLGGLLLLLTTFFVFSAPFSVWPGGTVDFIVNDWVRNVLLFFIVASYITSFDRVRTIAATIGLGLGYVGVTSLLSGQQSRDAARVMGANVSFGNSNDFAMAMLTGIPLCLWIAADSRRPIWLRGLALAMAPAMAFSMLQTGSRMMLVVTGVLGLFLFWKSRGPVRIAMVAGGLAVGMAAVAVMPRTTLLRLGTLFSPTAMTAGADPLNDPNTGEVNEQALNSAVDSTNHRLHLFKRSVVLAISNPIFGVGTKMFDVAENNLAQAEGKSRGSWQVAHNAYAEIAAENGIPAFIVFMLLILRAWQGLTRFEKLARDEHPRFMEWRFLSIMLKGAMLSYLACAMFLSIGYNEFLPLFAAMIVGADFALRRDQMLIARAEEAKKAPATPEPAYGYDYGYAYGPAAVSYSSDPAGAQGD